MEIEKKQITRKTEVIRFIITGVACAIADFLVTELFLLLLQSLPDIAKGCISTLAGFIVGVILNYILSTFWVFTGVDDTKKTKTPLFIFLFVVLSAIAFGLSFGTYELCHVIFLNAWGLNIYNQSIKEIFKFTFWGNAEFWLFAVAFVLKTFVGLIWNYFTRKYILYKNKNK